MDFSISSSDGKLLSALAEAIFSCVIEDTEKSYLGGTGGFFQTQKLNCSSDSTVCIHRISEAEVANNARRCLESFNLTKSSHEVGRSILNYRNDFLSPHGQHACAPRPSPTCAVLSSSLPRVSQLFPSKSDEHGGKGEQERGKKEPTRFHGVKLLASRKLLPRGFPTC